MQEVLHVARRLVQHPGRGCVDEMLFVVEVRMWGLLASREPAHFCARLMRLCARCCTGARLRGDAGEPQRVAARAGPQRDAAQPPRPRHVHGPGKC